MGTHFGFVSTYAPTHCGIATFTSSLVMALQGVGNHSTSVIRLVEADSHESARLSAPEVVAVLKAGDPSSLFNAVNRLNELDVAIIQHEFGIYGGANGDEILALLGALSVPTIVVVHTVLAEPSQREAAVLEEICSLAGAVITMSQAAGQQLISRYQVDPAKVHAIPHGARPLSGLDYTPKAHAPLILTWGLIGPGKGIEWGIEAMSELQKLECAPRYLVAGRTHPKVYEKSGEQYRAGLQKRIDDLGLTNSVRLAGDYMSSRSLDELIASAAVVLLPYDSTDQATSGVLIEAIAAWRPVVATGFPHARELLASGAGTIVGHRNPGAIAKAIREIIETPELALRMSNQARVQASDLLWPSIARQYATLASALIHAQVAA